MSVAISIQGVSKDFRIPGSKRRLRAVDNLNLEIDQASIFGLLGPNGSGKSTTIKMALGLIRPSEGRCEILGKSSLEPSARMGIGYLPEAPYFQRFLTGRELLRYFGKLSGLPNSNLQDRVDMLLAKVGLDDAGDRRVGGYSKGMLQRIGLAQAMIGDPEILILDEPTAGVDPIGAADIASIIRELRDEGRTVLLCSHLLSQVETICDRAAIMVKGKLALEGSVDSLTSTSELSSTCIDGLTTEGREKLEALAEEAGFEISTPRRSLEELFLELSKRGGDRK
jgi:ABC-2 type transport system ATP-binding protein